MVILVKIAWFQIIQNVLLKFESNSNRKTLFDKQNIKHMYTPKYLKIYDFFYI